MNGWHNPHTVRSADHPAALRDREACIACGGAGQLNGRECPRCEGTGRDRCYGVDNKELTQEN